MIPMSPFHLRIFCGSTCGNLKSNYKDSELTAKSGPSELGFFFLQISAQRRIQNPIYPQETTFVPVLQKMPTTIIPQLPGL